MNKTRISTIATVAALTLVACGGAEEPETAESQEPTAEATTQAATTTRATTTTTTPDPLDVALAPYVRVPVFDDVRAAFVTLCEGSAANDPEAINPTSSDTENLDHFRTAFSALCPAEEGKVGTLVMPSGDPVFDGYPVLVATASLDRRVANWLDTDQAVAVAPGVYAAYNPAVPDLWAYLTVPNEGDCVVRNVYFPNTGGTCWDGVLPGPDEPQQ